MVVRPVGLDDLAQARQLLIAAFVRLTMPHLPSDDAERCLKQLKATAFLDTLRGQALQAAWLHGMMVAVGGWMPASTNGGIARLVSVGVDPMFAGMGIGRHLVGRIEESACRAGFAEITVCASKCDVTFYDGLGYASIASAKSAPLGDHPRPAFTARKRLGHATQSLMPGNGLGTQVGGDTVAGITQRDGRLTLTIPHQRRSGRRSLTYKTMH